MLLSLVIPRAASIIVCEGIMNVHTCRGLQSSCSAFEIIDRHVHSLKSVAGTAPLRFRQTIQNL